jgi:hypothetical protein
MKKTVHLSLSPADLSAIDQAVKAEGGGVTRSSFLINAAKVLIARIAGYDETKRQYDEIERLCDSFSAPTSRPFLNRPLTVAERVQALFLDDSVRLETLAADFTAIDTILDDHGAPTVDSPFSTERSGPLSLPGRLAALLKIMKAEAPEKTGIMAQLVPAIVGGILASVTILVARTFL